MRSRRAGHPVHYGSHLGGLTGDVLPTVRQFVNGQDACRRDDDRRDDLPIRKRRSVAVVHP